MVCVPAPRTVTLLRARMLSDTRENRPIGVAHKRGSSRNGREGALRRRRMSFQFCRAFADAAARRPYHAVIRFRLDYSVTSRPPLQAARNAVSSFTVIGP